MVSSFEWCGFGTTKTKLGFQNDEATLYGLEGKRVDEIQPLALEDARKIEGEKCS